MTYYKAVREDYTDFRTGRVRYDVGSTVTHPNPHKMDASGYLSVATVPTDCTGMGYPLRLLEVEADDVWEDPGCPNKRCTHSLTVVRELDPALAFGPQGELVVALVERCQTVTDDELASLDPAWAAAAGDAARYAAWYAARDAAWAAAGDAARYAAWNAAWNAAWDAAQYATGALIARDLIGDTFTQQHYDLLTGPWRNVIGPLHPDDADLREEVPACARRTPRGGPGSARRSSVTGSSTPST